MPSGEHDLRTPIPPFYHFRYQLWRVLQINIDRDDGVARGKIQSRGQRSLLAKISRQINYFNSWKLFLLFKKKRQGSINAAIINEYDFSVAGQGVKYRNHPL